MRTIENKFGIISRGKPRTHAFRAFSAASCEVLHQICRRRKFALASKQIYSSNKTLYITDLDGTLLDRNQTVSEYTKTVLNALYARGTRVTYATARSLETSAIATQGVNFGFPRMVYNGAFIRDGDGSAILTNTFDGAGRAIIDKLLSCGLSPIVYSLIGGREKFSYVHKLLSAGEKMFISTRQSCVRNNPVLDTRELYDGDIFYIVCIDEAAKLEPLYEVFKTEFGCVLSVDPYLHNTWLEIMPKTATKANAVKWLKSKYNFKVTVFGDGKNDIDMFRAADESYAMENAVPELKAVATAVIGKNTDDGVAKWLESHLL